MVTYPATGRLLAAMLSVAVGVGTVNASMRSDSTREFLNGSASGFSVAATPPRVDFEEVRLDGYGSGSPWGSWGGITQGPDGCFYFTIGNHMGGGSANAILFRYDPVRKVHEPVFDSKRVCGWGSGDYGDGKLHAEVNIAPNGDSWTLTFFGPYPTPDDFASGAYPGGRLIYFNARTNVAQYKGIPYSQDSWPEQQWDWQRQTLVAVGEWGEIRDLGNYGSFLVYDTQNERTVFAGMPRINSQEVHWYRRSVFLDRQTGIVYGCESDSPYRLIAYDIGRKEFRWLNSRVPGNTYWRAYSHGRAQDGAFYCFNYNGEIFKFFPEQDRVETVGPNWTSGLYTGATMQTSPTGRYVYYVPGSSDAGPFPVVQYDVVTGRKKVLAFLESYYRSKYGYHAACTYGVAISSDGASLFISANGSHSDERYGTPAIFHVLIPQSERADEVVGIMAARAARPAGQAHARTGLAVSLVESSGPAAAESFSIRGQRAAKGRPASKGVTVVVPRLRQW